MFTHQGKKRTSKHNLQIASLLSFVAGIVNVAGFLAVAKLTTNVTGHFAFFVDEVFKLNFWQSFIYFLYIFFFFLGSFSSNFLVEVISRRNANYVYLVPTSIEALILVVVALLGSHFIALYPNLIACSLLFAMGLQNSLVTRISNATVRTTHLTGLFTDLGIELSQLFFYHDLESREKLFSSVRLRLTIISFFFTGGIVGGIFYSEIGLYVLLIGAGALISGIVFDNFKLKLKLLHRKYGH
ncbi:MAG: hypothetical protein CFE23_12910 [Flavobacterium sp. BFFFF1]|uniref:YoaK family protein n=1 Tax=unclassified Flavobacterium TaxID=196869 RepID=UPI000BDCEF26|nr:MULTISPECIES: YoaK family protein [unclassified Flavobacterium]OYU79714.1 MAG: hypothetical protein CFE23_12910 [Flavobacterium sp. BFFFF1]